MDEATNPCGVPNFRTRNPVHYCFVQQVQLRPRKNGPPPPVVTPYGFHRKIDLRVHRLIVTLDDQLKPVGPPSIRMPKIDQFESIFRAASKEAFEPATVQFERLMVVTDLDETASQPFCD